MRFDKAVGPHVSAWLVTACVAAQERDAKEAAENSLITYKEQLGFGVHVLVMMGTLYAVGHVAGMSLSKNKAYVRAVNHSPIVTVLQSMLVSGLPIGA